MRGPVICVLIVALFATTTNSARSAPVDLRQWFLTATAWNSPGTLKEIATADFLGGKQSDPLAMQSLCASNSGHKGFWIFPNWSLLAYDRKHHIGLASERDDGFGCALFKASPPPVTVFDADLSQSSTGRGVKVGSTYAQVLSAYGPPVRHGRHFVTSYSANVPGVTRYLPHKAVKLPERITLVIDDGYVSSILIYTSESGLY